MLNGGLKKFLAPTAPSRFFADAWEKTPRLIARRRPGYHEDLISSSDLDAVVAQIRAPAVEALMRVVRQEGKELLSKTVPTDGRGAPDRQALHRWMGEGYTLVLNELDQRWSPISMLARGLEDDFGHRVGVNAYFTPPRSQGFLPHADDHDVFILQVEGTKSWRIYKPLIELPTREIPQEEIRRSLGAPARVVTLAPGDLLYLPRGWIHECSTTRSASLHLTVGVHVFRWLDLAKQGLELAAKQSLTLRKALPPRALLDSRSAGSVRERWPELLDALAAVDAEEALRGIAAKFVESGQQPLDGRFARGGQAENLTLDSTVYRRVGMRCIASMQDRVASIRFPGNSVSGPFGIDPALRFIAAARRFRVKDLPESLEPGAKLVLVRRLVREGLLSTRRGS